MGFHFKKLDRKLIIKTKEMKINNKEGKSINEKLDQKIKRRKMTSKAGFMKS